MRASFGVWLLVSVGAVGCVSARPENACDSTCRRIQENRGYNEAQKTYYATGKLPAETPGSAAGCGPNEIIVASHCARRRGRLLFEAELRAGKFPCVAADPLCPKKVEPSGWDWSGARKRFERGFQAGYEAEREAYQKSGVVLSGSIVHVSSCMLLCEECGEAAGRDAFQAAFLNGREFCAVSDRECQEQNAADVRRRALEFEAGVAEGYAKLLERYHEAGSAELRKNGEEALPNCRSEPRACGLSEGARRAGRGLAEGREACAALDAGCSARRADRLSRETAVAPREVEILAGVEKQRPVAEKLVVEAEQQAKIEAQASEQAAKIEAQVSELEAKGEAILRGLENDELTCTSSFGEKVLREKKEAVERWSALSASERFDIAAAVKQAGKRDLEEAFAEAEAELRSYVPRSCIAGY